jgi:hypothetical protein
MSLTMRAPKSAHTQSLLRLPDELLVEIPLYIVTDMDRRHTMRLALICRYLRQLFIGIPQLWTIIDASWKPSVIALFLHRAQSQALSISFIEKGRGQKEYMTSIAQAGTLSIEMEYTLLYRKDDMLLQWDIADTLRRTDMPMLRSLKLVKSSPVRTQDAWRIEPHFITAASCTHLTTFKVHQGDVDGLPNLPQLQCLELVDCVVALPHLLSSLAHTLRLERVELRGVRIPEDNAGTLHVPPGPVNLPVLLHLSITANFCLTAAIVSALPIPQRTFIVMVEDDVSDNPLSTPYASAIMGQLTAFWDLKHCHESERELPIPELTRRTDAKSWDAETHLSFGAATRDGSLFCRYPVTAVAAGVLDRVERLCVEYSKDRPGCDPLDTPMPHINLRELLKAKFLVVTGAEFDPYADEEAAKSLKDWIVSRHKQRIPFHSIKFRSCGGTARALFEHIKTKRMAKSVTWESE